MIDPATDPFDIPGLKDLITTALAEDVGAGDATTTALIAADDMATASLRSRESCVIAGLEIFRLVMQTMSPRLKVTAHVNDGERCAAGCVLATVSGPAGAMLTAERTALNFLQRMTGIATTTAEYVAALAGARTRILDTRKTLPGLRLLDKYAVTAGGGANNRIGLYDRIMIKDNHIFLVSRAAGGTISSAVHQCRERFPALDIEVEADTLEQVREALVAGADYVLLDNMSTREMTEAVAMRNAIRASALLEASGGISLARIPELGKIGLDFISVGALTHSVRAVDIGLDLDSQPAYP